MPSTEVVILDDNGHPLPLGERGETAKAMAPDGFFESCDIGIMDERGQVKIVHRKKDMIPVSGFDVSPNEVEHVVTACPGVVQSAAIGVPDANSGKR